MKTTFKFMIAATAAIAVFSSCQKELANDTANKTTDGVRTISVQFDNSTKASLNDLTPTFTNNDKIRVSNTEKSEECTVTVSEATATFTTTLSGALTAIYPADAAVLGTGVGQPIEEPYFKVSASQDGTIEKAIIAKAEIADESSSATFIGQTALFQITPPSGTTSVTITSLNTIDPATGQRSTTANASLIDTEGSSDAEKRVITVTVPSGGTAYVSLVPGVNLTDLLFDAGETYGMKGIPMKDIKDQATSLNKTVETVNATAANTKYTIGNANNSWYPYVEIQMTVNSVTKTYKWAKWNLGGEKETDYGDYYVWGATEKAYSAVDYTNGVFTFVSSNPYGNIYMNDWNKSRGFNWENYPFTNGVYHWRDNKTVFTKYVPNAQQSEFGEGGTFSDDKTVLDIEDDAANKVLGGSWRMPTKEEFDALCSLSKEWKTNYNDSDVKGYLFEDENNKTIFLPTTSYGSGTERSSNYKDYGRYWSSSLFTDGPKPYLAHYLCFFNGTAAVYTYDRCYGQCVRALSE